MSDINITVNDEIVNIDVIDTPVVVEVTNSPGPAGAGVAAGGTTGQVLAKASNTNYDTVWVNPSTGGVPYSGATGNVNIGEYELKAGQVTLDTSPTGTAAVGTIRWNDTTGTSETTLKGGNVILKNGVDLVARVVNKVTPNATLTKAAYQAVRVSGAQGQRLAVAYAQANNDANSADTIGIVIETIATNQEGFIMTVGQLEGINTTGSLQGESWADGDVLYLSPTTPGALTNIKPTAVTGHIVVVGYVEYAHANNGKIYIKIMNGWELDELHNVSIVSPANNQGLFYNSTNTLWENKTISTALGYTPVPTTRNITINGVTYDLSADRTYTISTGISGSGASGQVTYWTGASAVSGSADLTLNTLTGRLILSKIIDGALAYNCTNTSTGSNAQANYSASNGTNSVSYGVYGTNTVTYGALTANNGFFYSTRGIVFMADNATNGILQFATGGNTERMRIDVNGNVGIGVTPTVRFQVAGDTLLRGSGATSATTALTVQNSSSTNLFTVRNDGNVGIGTASPASPLHISGSGTGAAGRTWLRVQNTSANSGSGVQLYNASNRFAYMQYTASSYGIGEVLSFFTDSDYPVLFATNGVSIGGGTSHIAFSPGGYANEAVRFTGTKNVLIGTTTDGGQRLQVIGDTLLRGSGATSATTALTVQNSNSTNLLRVTNDGAVYLGANQQGVNTDNISLTRYLICNSTVGAVFGSYTSFNSKAVLQCDSTTKGFLPPRMTTTQKNAITTPPAGLVVYDTDLNKLCVYTTAWETITSI